MPQEGPQEGLARLRKAHPLRSGSEDLIAPPSEPEPDHDPIPCSRPFSLTLDRSSDPNPTLNLSPPTQCVPPPLPPQVPVVLTGDLNAKDCDELAGTARALVRLLSSPTHPRAPRGVPAFQ